MGGGGKGSNIFSKKSITPLPHGKKNSAGTFVTHYIFNYMLISKS